MCKVACAHAGGNVLVQTVYGMSIAPVKPGAGVNVYVPSLLITIVPVVAGIVPLPVTFNGELVLLRSFVNKLPAIAVPVVVAP